MPLIAIVISLASVVFALFCLAYARTASRKMLDLSQQILELQPRPETKQFDPFRTMDDAQ